MSFGSWNASFNTIAIVGFHYHALCVTFIMKWGPNILPRTHLLLLFNAVDWILKKAGVLEKKLETHRSPCWILNLRKIKVKLFCLPANVCFCISGKEDSNVNSFRTFFYLLSFFHKHLSICLLSSLEKNCRGFWSLFLRWCTQFLPSFHYYLLEFRMCLDAL